MIIHQLATKISDLHDTANTQQADQCLLEVMNALNCGNFTYNYYSKQFAHSNIIEHSLCTYNTHAWQAHYRQHNFELIDPMLARIRQSHLPISWILPEEIKRSPKNTVRVYHAALDFGLQGGFAIPLHGPQGTFANLVVQDLAAHALFATYPQAEYELQILAIHYHAQIVKLLTATVANTNLTLTVREKQCLQLTAKHLTAKQIAQRLNLMPRTVSFHLENIIRKFNVNSKYAAVSIAKTIGLID